MSLFIGVTLYTVLLSVITIGTLRINPRLFLQDYPEEIIEQVAKKNIFEKLLSLCIGIPFILIYLAYPICFALNYVDEISFTSIFFTCSLFFTAFNIIDLFILDYLIFVKWTPSFLVIEGTKGHPSYKDMTVHLDGFKKGMTMGILFSTVYSLITII